MIDYLERDRKERTQGQFQIPDTSETVSSSKLVWNDTSGRRYLGEFVSSDASLTPKWQPIWGNVEISGKLDVEAFHKEVEKLLREDKDK